MKEKEIEIIKNEIAALNILYYQMHMTFLDAKRYEDDKNWNKKENEFKVKCYNINKNSFEDQQKKVNDLIIKLAKS